MGINKVSNRTRRCFSFNVYINVFRNTTKARYYLETASELFFLVEYVSLFARNST